MPRFIQPSKIIAKAKNASFKAKLWFLAALIIFFSTFYLISNNVAASPIAIRQEINVDDTIRSTATGGTAGIGRVMLDTTKYSGTVSYYFEIVSKTGTGPFDTSLTRVSGGTLDATITTPGTQTTYARIRTSFTPPASTQTEYNVTLSGSATNWQVSTAKIIILQSSDPSLSSTETQIEIGNYELDKANTAASPLTNPKYWKYTAANWDGTKTFSAEATHLVSTAQTSVTVTLQEDNGSFSGWSDVATIVSASTATTPTRSRATFTPTDGRNYRISALESSSQGSRRYSIYNAKIIVSQSGTPTKYEPQYLLSNTADIGTGLQSVQTLWNSSEWVGVTNSYKFAMDSDNASNSAKLQDIDNSNTDVTGATATGANQQVSSAFTMPTSGHQIDVNVTNSTGVVAATRILAAVSVNTNSSPGAPTFSSPSNGSTVISTTPSFVMSSTDADSDTIKYDILIYNGTSNNGTNCTGSLNQENDQNTSGTGWDNGTTAYSSGASATYTIQAGSALTRGNSYCYQAKAKDLSGSNVFGSLSTYRTLTVNSVPVQPTLSSPSSSATGVSLTPQFTFSTTDADSAAGDYLQYRLYLYASDCSTPVGSSPFAQSSSQTGWSGQNAGPGGNTAYTSGTTATYTYQSILSNSTTYCWKVDAFDANGSNTYSTASGTRTFTTADPNTSIQGGSVIQGGSIIH